MKNSKKGRIVIAAFVLALITAAEMVLFMPINRQAEYSLSSQKKEQGYDEKVFEDWVSDLYKGCYVLYYETQRENRGKSAYEIFMEVQPQTGFDTEYMDDLFETEMGRLSGEFSPIRSVFDYCILLEEGNYKKNTIQPLEEAVKKSDQSMLRENYTDYFLISFDESGAVEVQPIYSSMMNADQLVKYFDMISTNNIIRERIGGNYDAEGSYRSYTWKMPQNFSVIFGIPDTESAKQYMCNTDNYLNGEYTYWELSRAYSNAGIEVLYFGAAAVTVLFAFLMMSRKIFGTPVSMNRPGNCYLFEAALTGILFLLVASENIWEFLWGANSYQSFYDMYLAFTGGGMIDMIITFFVIFIINLGWYLCGRFLRPLFSLGLMEYIRQYSLIYLCMFRIKESVVQFGEKIRHVDMSRKSNQLILKIIIFNLLITSVCACMWFFGIFALLLYSGVLFFFCMRYFEKIKKDYEQLLEGMKQIAAGDLNAELPKDLGLFEPIKEELFTIRHGLKRAVEKEVRSERMKTELITNVSHDLKTPLTAITTYIELLKNENITKEERDSYIEILETKSMRLKVLIEDLFEVSKASSRNIQLNLTNVDVVNLLKQVSVEHIPQFEQSLLALRWEIPDKKVIVRLDSTKTYRIFENLFVNICKYAMPGSRVYIAVKELEKRVFISVKNISAEEIFVNADELTDRFVRGDVSRNTEGSGLGLAIAKSFTEAQQGTFSIEIDGDLFKVSISFPY